ncbi:DNA alkylation repair protein [Metabacillus iocasae]|uniref:3-methyladenine DNA glycosylase AlkD n=1 Tax=Priestia iocasae TaxID=2291674 RepID=A0ABS2QVW5_9BACI|nr:DNA alkylation repair protein [Metabacillus iocasae]MBM7703611.1 3-methyladenine DNA glycosylase AlkD [Metabacillus iocasae]
MNLEQLMKELEALGSEQTRKTYYRHGARDPLFGIRIGDLKKFVKVVKKDQDLGMALYNTDNHDAMYLAGLSINPKNMSKEQLQEWVEKAYWYMLSEYTVASVAAESPYALELAREWMQSDVETIATAGWSTYSNYLSIADDEELNLDEVGLLLREIGETIHHAPNRVRYTMNQFVICVGTYVKPLVEEAKDTAKRIGKVSVNMGDTACKVPLATSYIQKVEERSKVGVKKKTTRC